MIETAVETLHGSDGSAYQTRVKSGPHFRIHIFWRGDRDPDMHDHPADFWTFPLVSYVEEINHRWSKGHTEWRVVRAFRLHHRKAEFRHRVLGAWTGEKNRRTGEPMFSSRPIVTLGWWSRKRREWGFQTANGWTPWREYVSNPGWSASPGAPPSSAEEPGK